MRCEPRDLNVLPENESRKDARTLDKLIDGKNQGEEKHSWLAPFTETNAIFVCFDAAVAISRLTLWNYAKTPARGVRELDVFVDDVLVYRGVLKRAPEASQGQTVLFTNAQPVVESERHRIYNDVEESCLFIDEGRWSSSFGPAAADGGVCQMFLFFCCFVRRCGPALAVTAGSHARHMSRRIPADHAMPQRL